MEFQSVISSNINGIAYDEATSTLYVEFKSGARYKYTSVPEEEYDAFLEAASPGSFFASNIKDVYPAQRV